MPHRRSIASLAISPQRRRFRERDNELEVRRAKLLARLHLFGEAAQHHPVYKRGNTAQRNFSEGKGGAACGCTKVGGVADQFIGTAPRHLVIG